MPKRKNHPPQNLADCLAPGLSREDLPSTLPVALRKPRRIITRSGSRVRGELADPRFQSAQWESELECALLYILRISKRAARFVTQPLVLEIGARQYTPDCLVFTPEKKRIWLECKPKTDLLDQEVQAELAQVHQTLTALGERFIVLDDDTLSLKLPVVQNAHQLALWLDLHGRAPAPHNGSASFGELSREHGPERVLASMAQGLYAFDWRRRIDSTTAIWWDNGAKGYEPDFLHVG